MEPPARVPPPCPFAKVHPSQLQRDDTFYMWQAYNQAIDAWREDEVPIGAVIELGGEVIAEVVSLMTGVPLTRLEKEEAERLLELENELHKRVISQEEAISAVAH